MTSHNLIDDLRAYFSYDPETGQVSRKVANGRWKAGQSVGGIDSKGHCQIRFRGRLYLAHRLIWVLHYGRWPEGEIDHINRDRSDNRIANLRECSHRENSRNRGVYASNTSGVSGVSWYGKLNKWVAYIRAGNKRTHLGYFENKDDAIKARRDAERTLFADFRPQHGVQFHNPELGGASSSPRQTRKSGGGAHSLRVVTGT